MPLVRDVMTRRVVAVSPDDRRIYVANNEGSYATTHPGTTTVINATTGAVMDTLPVGGCAVAVSDNTIVIRFLRRRPA